jgi:hypothetical protein
MSLRYHLRPTARKRMRFPELPTPNSSTSISISISRQHTAKTPKLLRRSLQLHQMRNQRGDFVGSCHQVELGPREFL